MTEKKDEILDALNEEVTSGSQDTLDSMWDIDETGLNEALGLETSQADPILDIEEKKPEAKEESKEEVTEEVTEKTEEKIEEPEFDEDSTGEKGEVKEIKEEKEEKEPEKETPEEVNENEFSLFAKMLAEKEILDLDEDFESTEQGLIDAFEKSITSRVGEEIRSFQQSLPQDGKELLAHLMNGGRVNDFSDTYAGTDIVNVDVSGDKEENQKIVLKEFLRLRGDSVEEAEETVNDYKDLGKLEKQAEKAKEKLVHFYNTQKQNLAQKQKEAKQMQEQKRTEVITTIQDTIKDSSEIKGFPLSRKHKKDLVAYMTMADNRITGADGEPTYVTKFQADEMEASQDINDFILRAYLRMTGFDLSSANKKAVSNYSSQLKSALQNKKSMTDTKAKFGGSTGAKSKGTGMSWDI